MHPPSCDLIGWTGRLAIEQQVAAPSCGNFFQGVLRDNKLKRTGARLSPDLKTGTLECASSFIYKY